MSGNLWQFLKRITGDETVQREPTAGGIDDGTLQASPVASAPLLHPESEILNDPHLPRSFRAGAPSDGAVRPRRFDPALLHYQSAFRPGDPEFHDQETGRRWAVHRRRITDHVLRHITESALGDHLILRGSRLLKAWLGDLAREPGG
jgi:hypothetical protein